MLSVRGLTKSYGSLKVLNGISFDVACGDVLAVIGPSGSGKSTAIRCINALETFQGGEILLEGKPIVMEVDSRGRRRQQPERELARLRAQVGMVFQSFNLFPHKTVLDNVLLGPLLVLGQDRRTAQAIAMELLVSVGLADKANAYPGKLSGGQQQRVAIARALAMSPKVLLLDEITSALDSELVGEVLSVVRRLAERGITMVLVTHEIAFARDVGSKLIFMEKGSIVEEGTPNDVLGAPKTERLRSFLSRFNQGPRKG